MKTWQIIVLAYIGVLSLVGFFSMFIDKMKAKHNKWRIPEATLFIIALLGGSIGSVLGMYTFHHKTKHKKFTIFMPLIMVAQIVIVVILFTKL